MLTGAHAVIYSRNADADRAFLRDVLGFAGVDAGGGWLIFGLPPGEVAVHPAEENDEHELFLMCDDVQAFVAEMSAKGVACSPIQTPPWGALTQVSLPGGGKLGVYEPRHARPEPMRVKAATKGKGTKKGKAPKNRPTPKVRRQSGARASARKSARKKGRRP
jgi:catechol 2,3-dioxygenase-like lactoylglutathione lyase family enzyme